MPWPIDTDYNEAIQNPHFAFADPDLQLGQVQSNAIGLPKARSGNMATVYRVETRTGPYAVRCFLRQNLENGPRYTAIQYHFTSNPLPYLVDFRFLPRGIRVAAQWYPTVKMQWINGVSLSSFIEGNLGSPERLRTMASDWVTMLTVLKSAGIAHGDLQHGNVLIVQGRLRLVDYDGCYVPSLRGKRATELGHPNYQHPRRSAVNFGPELDNFSGWLIYLSLIAAAGQPKLWREIGGGDECLLFRRRDLETPQQSQIFRLLMKHPDERVRALSLKLRSFLAREMDQTPPVIDYFRSSAPPELRFDRWAAVRLWLKDRLDLDTHVRATKRRVKNYIRDRRQSLLPARKQIVQHAARISVLPLEFARNLMNRSSRYPRRVFPKSLDAFRRQSLLPARKQIVQHAARISVLPLEFARNLMNRSSRYPRRVFPKSLDAFRVAKVVLSIGAVIFAIALLFKLWSPIHRTGRPVSQTAKTPVIPRILVGRWRGTAVEPRRGGQKVSVRFNISQQFSSSAQGRGCRAILSPISFSARSAAFHEHFVQRVGSCQDDTVTLDYSAGNVHFSKNGPFGVWRGILKRVPSANPKSTK